MKKQTKIYMLNFATVIFAALTVISLGSIGTLPVYTVMVNTALFALLAYNCSVKEAVLRSQLKARRHRKPRLEVYSGKAPRRAA